jgi:hypothetical protein
LALNVGEDDEARFRILGILFGGGPEHKYRLAKQVDLISEEVGNWEKEYPFACPHGEMLLSARDYLSLFCGTEYGAGNFQGFEGVFRYMNQDFRLVFSAEDWRNGSMDYTHDSLDLVSGRRWCEKGNYGERKWAAPVIKEDTVSLPEPITFDNFLEKWKGISEFIGLEEMRKRGKLLDGD